MHHLNLNPGPNTAMWRVSYVTGCHVEGRRFPHEAICIINKYIIWKGVFGSSDEKTVPATWLEKFAGVRTHDVLHSVAST